MLRRHGVSNPFREQIRELAPVTSKIAALTNPNFPGSERQLRDVEAAARVIGLQFIVESYH
jgi:hypothetical protein